MRGLKFIWIVLAISVVGLFGFKTLEGQTKIDTGSGVVYVDKIVMQENVSKVSVSIGGEDFEWIAKGPNAAVYELVANVYRDDGLTDGMFVVGTRFKLEQQVHYNVLISDRSSEVMKVVGTTYINCPEGLLVSACMSQLKSALSLTDK